MTFPRYAMLAGYWAKRPPEHLALAAFLGVKGRGNRGHDPASKAEATADLQKALALVPGAQLKKGVPPGIASAMANFPSGQ